MVGNGRFPQPLTVYLVYCANRHKLFILLFMQYSANPSLRLLLSLAFCCTLFALAACDFVNSVTQTGALTPTPQFATPGATAVPNNIDPGQNATPIVPTTTLSATPAAPLKIWVPTDPPGLSEAEADELVTKLIAFANSPSELPIQVQKKGLSDPGGILNYLRTGRGLADAALPDLVLLPAEQLPIAVTEGLIYPLEEFINRDETLAQLYPAAAALGQIDGELVGYPIALTNLTHLAYDNAVITATLPLRWNELISSTNATFLYPASGYEGAIFTYQMYQALGGQLVNETGQPVLLSDPLIRTLSLLQQARVERPLIVADSLNTTTLNQAWEEFHAGSANMLLTTAEQYQKQQAEPIPAFSAIAGPSGALSPLVNGWVLVITATEARRPLAATYLRAVTSVQNIGEWSEQHQLLPSSPAAFATWVSEDAYHLFLERELARALPNPLPKGGAMTLALQNAAFEVLSQDFTPEEAAQRAVEALSP